MGVFQEPERRGIPRPCLFVPLPSSISANRFSARHDFGRRLDAVTQPEDPPGAAIHQGTHAIAGDEAAPGGTLLASIRLKEPAAFQPLAEIHVSPHAILDLLEPKTYHPQPRIQIF